MTFCLSFFPINNGNSQINLPWGKVPWFPESRSGFIYLVLYNLQMLLHISFESEIIIWRKCNSYFHFQDQSTRKCQQRDSYLSLISNPLHDGITPKFCPILPYVRGSKRAWITHRPPGLQEGRNELHSLLSANPAGFSLVCSYRFGGDSESKMFASSLTSAWKNKQAWREAAQARHKLLTDPGLTSLVPWSF